MERACKQQHETHIQHAHGQIDATKAPYRRHYLKQAEVTLQLGTKAGSCSIAYKAGSLCSSRINRVGEKETI